MVVWMVYVLVSVAVITVLSLLSSMFGVSEKTTSNMDVYECGIEAVLEEKTPFYLHFYLIGILFLLFDVELIVCIPMVWMVVFEKVWSVIWFIFFFILFLGLVVEMVVGSFSWKE